MKKLPTLCTIVALSISASLVHAVDLKSLRSIGTDLAKAASLSDADIIEGSRNMMVQMDEQNGVAPSGSDYARRLARLTDGLENEDGLTLNFAVYMSDDVNTFATPDGSIRVYAGLMDLMTDDELRGVIGHEIGHAKLGHAKSQMKNALLMSAGTKAAGLAGGTVGKAVAANAKTIEAFAGAQFSQKDETASDDYGFDFMRRHKHDPAAMASAFRKLAKLSSGGGNTLMSSHPEPASRARRVEDKLAKN